jgi:hypothetical protein
MANRSYTVYTDLSPDALTEVAVETYRQWLAFALGKEAVGGRTLKHPEGRYAASLSWKRTGVASVAIIADESVAPEVGWIEEGHGPIDLKAAMLGKGNTHTSKAGYQYRAIPIREVYGAPTAAPKLVGNPSKGQSLHGKQKGVWAKPRPYVDPNNHVVTMSDAPGSSAWRIPAMLPYSPASYLASLIAQKYGSASAVP